MKSASPRNQDISLKLIPTLSDESPPTNVLKEKLLTLAAAPSDQELEDLLNKEASTFKVDANTYELGRKIMPLTIGQFYASFLSHEAPMNFRQYFLDKPGTKDVKLSKELSSQATFDPSAGEVYSVSVIIPLVGVPFMKQSRFIKDVRILRPKRYATPI